MVGENELSEAEDCLYRALSCLGRGKDAESWSNVNTALELGLSTPDKALAHYIRGILHFRQEKFQEAEMEIREAFKLDDTLGNKWFLTADAWKKLAQIHEKRGETTRAIETLQNGITRLQTRGETWQG